MTLKSRLILLLTMAALVLCMIIVGILAASQQKISMLGTINFNIGNRTLYLQDVRLQQSSSQLPQTVFKRKTFFVAVIQQCIYNCKAGIVL